MYTNKQAYEYEMSHEGIVLKLSHLLTCSGFKERIRKKEIKKGDIYSFPQGQHKRK